jgi:hypothetical protein
VGTRYFVFVSCRPQEINMYRVFANVFFCPKHFACRRCQGRGSGFSCYMAASRRGAAKFSLEAAARTRPVVSFEFARTTFRFVRFWCGSLLGSLATLPNCGCCLSLAAFGIRDAQQSAGTMQSFEDMAAEGMRVERLPRETSVCQVRRPSFRGLGAGMVRPANSAVSPDVSKAKDEMSANLIPNVIS